MASCVISRAQTTCARQVQRRVSRTPTHWRKHTTVATARTAHTQCAFRATSVAPASTRRASAIRTQARAVAAPSPHQASAAEGTPLVKIDNACDAFATVVHVQHGDGTPELVDTVTTLRKLGLNIRKAKVSGHELGSTFYITEDVTSEKVVKSSRLEEIRSIIVRDLCKAQAGFAMWGRSVDAALTTSRPQPPMTINVEDHTTGSCSVLALQMTDRPGLLLEVVQVLKDLQLNVVSAEVNTVGASAEDKFFVTYQGGPVPAPMVHVMTAALRYYL